MLELSGRSVQVLRGWTVGLKPSLLSCMRSQSEILIQRIVAAELRERENEQRRDTCVSDNSGIGLHLYHKLIRLRPSSELLLLLWTPAHSCPHHSTPSNPHWHLFWTKCILSSAYVWFRTLLWGYATPRPPGSREPRPPPCRHSSQVKGCRLDATAITPCV